MAKDAKGHGSEKRRAFTAKYGATGGTMASRDAQARVNEFTTRSAARQAELVAGGKSAMDAYHQTGDEFKNGPPGGYEHDRKAAAALAAPGNPKSMPAPVHPDMNPRYSREAVDNAIASSNRSGRRIGGREAKAIHALLKGRH